MAHTTALPTYLISAFLVTVIVYGVANYVPIMKEESNRWFQAPVNPFTATSPVLLLGVDTKGKELTVKVYRSYAWPFARQIEVHIELCSGLACVSHFLKERVPLGSTREYIIPLTGIRSVEIKTKVTVMIGGTKIVSELLEVDVSD